MGLLTATLEWTQRTLEPLGVLGLFILAFIESSFFPIPPDILLLVLSLQNPEAALWYALIATAGSVLGGMFGYLIGWMGEKAVLEKFVSKEKIARVHYLFNRYEGWAIFIAGFTPIPYKVFTIAAGVFYVNFRVFVLMSLLSRGLRFFLEALLIIWLGQAVISFIDQYFGPLTLLTVIIVALLLYVHKKKKAKIKASEPIADRRTLESKKP